MVSWKSFAYVNLICASMAAALWYIFPQLMAWPLLLGVVPWLLRLAHEGRWRWRTPFDWPLLLFLISALISVWAAFDKEMAWTKFWAIVAGVLLYYALAAFSLPDSAVDDRRWGKPAAWFLAIVGTAVSVYFLASNDWNANETKFAVLSIIGRSLQGPLPSIPGHRINPNVVGGMLAMLIPFSAILNWEAGRARKWPALIIGSVIFVVMLLGLVLSGSRGAWIAVLGALGLAIIWWVTGAVDVKKAGRRRLVFAGTLLFGAIAFMAAMILVPDIRHRLIESLAVLPGGTNRLDLYRNSLILVQEYPFIGAGLNSFMMLYSSYAFLTHVGFIFHAHNFYLDVMIEQGIVAVLALLWMFGIFATALWRESYDGRIRPYLGAAALSVVTILLHGFVEDALYGSRGVMLFFVPLAFALPFPQRNEESVAQRRWMVQGLGLGLLAAALIMWIRPLQSAAISNLTAVRQSQAELGIYEWPGWPIQDALRREVDLTGVTSGYERALAVNPSNAAANRRLGQVELSLGEYRDAQKHLELAYEQTPWDNATRQLLGEALLTNGRSADGKELWAGVNNAQGQLNARAFWYEFIADEERLAMIEEGLGE